MSNKDLDVVCLLILIKKKKVKILEQLKVNSLPHLQKQVVKGIKGFKLDSFLVAYEGWRRGLTLKWYKDETDECRMSRLNSSTHGKFFSLESNEKKHYFFRSRGDRVDNKTVALVQNKDKTKGILEKKGVSVPQGRLFNLENEKDTFKYAKTIGYPVVVKPLDGSMGRGVFVNIKNKKELKEVIAHYNTKLSYKRFLIEKHYFGKEYRFYVVGNKVASIIHRIPANVICDGQRTIEQLIKIKNEQRKSNPYLASKPIKVDYEVETMLKNQNLKLTSIPKENEQIFLRQLSNLSAGGDPIDCTNEITSEVKQLAIDTLKSLPNIPHAGVDIIVNPKDPKKGVVLEVNATAEISFHSYPLSGEIHDVPKAIIDYYFPETANQARTQYYFDYNSLLPPLKTH